jgi:hippurate hydrolase
MAGAPAPEIEHSPGGKMVINDAALVQRLVPSLKSAFGAGLVEMPPSSPAFPASEDYSEFIEAGVPSIYYWIGGYDPLVIAELKAKGEPVPMNHSPFFAPRPQQAIRNGAKALVLSVLAVAPRP